MHYAFADTAPPPAAPTMQAVKSGLVKDLSALEQSATRIAEASTAKAENTLKRDKLIVAARTAGHSWPVIVAAARLSPSGVEKAARAQNAGVLPEPAAVLGKHAPKVLAELEVFGELVEQSNTFITTELAKRDKLIVKARVDAWPWAKIATAVGLTRVGAENAARRGNKGVLPTPRHSG